MDRARSPLPSALPQPEKPFVPYIFRREELQGLFKNSHATLSRSVDNPSLRMLLQLLYGAGLRLSEALRLRWADVDWKTGVLTIGDTKFFKTRWVPLARPYRLGGHHQAPFDLDFFPADGCIDWPSSLHGLDDLQTSGVADLEGIEALRGFSGV